MLKTTYMRTILFINLMDIKLQIYLTKVSKLQSQNIILPIKNILELFFKN